MARIKVADYIIQYLADAGIQDMFVVYGSANGDLIDAFTRIRTTRYIAMMHEQAAGFAAEGYARVTGKFGVAIVTSGPGAMNLVTPVGNCFYESVPCLFITGQANTKFLRRSADIRQNAFQEADIVSIMKPITKYAAMVTSAVTIRYQLDLAIQRMREGRPGPVVLDIPLDIQKTVVEDRELEGIHTTVVNTVYQKSLLDTFTEDYLKDLATAQRPVIVVGGGVKLAGASNLVRELITALGVPAFPTWNAMDVITSDFPLYGGRIGTYGGPGRNFAIQNSDLVLFLGSRVSGRITGGVPSSFMRNAKKYIVDIDEALFRDGNHDVAFDVTLPVDVYTFLSHVLFFYPGHSPLPQHTAWRERVLEWRETYRILPPVPGRTYSDVHPYVFAEALSECCNSSDVIITDCGGNVVIMNQTFRTKYGQKVFSNNSNSPMGFSFAASIGASLATRSTERVICVIGDGGMNMNIQELQTLINYDVDVKVFILNNHIYGITKAFQETNFEGRCEACGPVGYTPPNFITVAEAYGLETAVICVATWSVLVGQIEAILKKKGPMIIDVRCDEYHTYEPRIFGWNTPIEDMFPYIDRAEFEKNMIVSMAPGYDYKNPPVPGVKR